MQKAWALLIRLWTVSGPLKGDGRLSDDITVQEIDSPVVPEVEKKKHDRKKSFQPGRARGA